MNFFNNHHQPVACVHLLSEFFLLTRNNECNISFVEHFYLAAHGSSPPRPSAAGGGKCPFRAALQAQSLHTTAAETSPTSSKSCKTVPAPRVKEEEEEREGGLKHPGVHAPSSNCKCVAEGLRPKGIH